ncbi:MAG: hypothetical protein U0R70_07035 [Solirubrobacteraceae bacterium]
MALTRRHFIAGAGQMAALMAVSGLEAPAQAAGATATDEPTAVLIARWTGVTEDQFVKSYYALSDTARAFVPGNTGVLVTWAPDISEGQIATEWVSADAARKFLSDPATARTLRDNGGTPPTSRQLILVSAA